MKYIIRKYLEACEGKGILVASYETYREARNHLTRLRRRADRLFEQGQCVPTYSMERESEPVAEGAQYTYDQDGRRVYHGVSP